MSKTRNLSDLLDANGDVKSTALDNVPASNDASALTTGTLDNARLPSSIDISGTLTANGVDLGDSEKIRLGASQDLEIYHNGTDNYIYSNNKTLRIQGNGSAIKMSPVNADNSANFNANGSVDLYYDNSKKFETTSSGVTVTGDLNVTGNILQPYFFGWGITSSSSASGWRQINFGTEEYDTDNAFVHTTGVFTAPESCLMAFFAGAMHQNGSHGEYLIKFNSNVNGTLAQQASTFDDRNSVSMLYKPIVNEQIVVQVYHSNTSHPDNGGRSQYFGGFKVT